MSGAASNPAALLRRLRARDGTATPVSGDPADSARALGGNPRSTAMPVHGTSAGAAALARFARDAAEALASPDPDLRRERAEIAAGLRAEASDPTRAGMVEVLPNGTRLHYCCECGRLASWGFDVAPERGREGTWCCFEHKERG
jgi:hypothetical protein